MDKAARIEYLKSLMEEDPQDPFAPYALCLEQAGPPEEKAANWLALTEKFPQYLPAYYHAGMAIKESGGHQKALMIWKKGVELAELQGDRHAAAELRSAIQNALVEEDED